MGAKAAASAADRVRKLLRLSRSPEKHEADRAAERARELIEKYGFSEEDLREEETRKHTLVIDNEQRQERIELARIIGASWRCQLLSSRHGAQMAFRGMPGTVEAARDVYLALAQAADTQAQMTAPAYADDTVREVWRLCFWVGFVQAIDTRLRAREGAAKNATGRGGGAPASAMEATLAEAFEDALNETQNAASLEDDVVQAQRAGDALGQRVAIAMPPTPTRRMRALGRG